MNIRNTVSPPGGSQIAGKPRYRLPVGRGNPADRPGDQTDEVGIDISIVVPFHNEQDSVGQVIEECRAALDAMSGLRGEIVAIDDGSEDRTAPILVSAAREDSRIRVLTFRRNLGQAPALYHGIKKAGGDILVTLDGDGQNNPADIPLLVERLQSSGAGLVSGIRVNRHDSLLRKFMSRLANRIRGGILNDDVTDSGCALKVFRSSVANALIPIQTLYSFIPALAKAAGHKIVECPVDHRSRIGGKTHYGLGVFLWRPALDMMGVWWFSRRRFVEVPPIETGGETSPEEGSGIFNEKPVGKCRTALLAAGIVAVFLSQLGSYGLMEPDEGRYAEIGREMAAPGASWLIPTLNDIPHFQKPPMLYWLTASSLKVFGTNEFATRIPSALSAIGALLLTLGIARKLFPDPSTARYALIILASSPLFLFLGRTLTPDMHMTFWITAAIFCLVHSRDDGAKVSLRWGWLFFVCMGLGFLTKGPVAFVVPISAAIGYSITLRRARRVQGCGGNSPSRLRLPWVFGLPLALLIGLSWFLVISAKNPDLANYFLKHELIDRFGSGTHGRSKPFWFFVPVLLGAFLPWTFIGVRLFPLVLRNRTAEFGLFVGWIVIPFVILSISGSKLPTYILPLLPALSITIGAGISLAVRQNLRLHLIFRIAMAMILMAVALLPLVVAQFVLDPSPGISFGALLYAALVVAGITFWLVRWSKADDGAVVPLGILALLAFLALPPHLNSWNGLLEQQACVKPLADRILAETPPESGPPRVIACEIRAHGLEFYLGRSVEITRKEADVVLPANELDPGFPVIHKLPKHVARLESPASGEPIFVVTRQKRREIDFADKDWLLLQTAGDFVLLRRKKTIASHTANPMPATRSG